MKHTCPSNVSNLGIVICKDDLLVRCAQLFTGSSYQLLSRVVLYFSGSWPDEDSQRGSKNTKRQENYGNQLHIFTYDTPCFLSKLQGQKRPVISKHVRAIRARRHGSQDCSDQNNTIVKVGNVVGNDVMDANLEGLDPLAYWQGHQGSNPRPTVLETVALPTELYPCSAGVTKPPLRDSQGGNQQK